MQHVPNYILLFVPQLRLCALHQHSRIFINLKCSHKRKETICIDKNCKKKKDRYQDFVLTSNSPPHKKNLKTFTKLSPLFVPHVATFQYRHVF